MGINLVKGQKINLQKSDGVTPLKKVVVGLGWNISRGGDSIDLDASCAMFDANKQLIDKVHFGQLSSNDRSVKHSGDNLTGEGDGDDEQITVDLERVDTNIQSIVVTISSYRGHTFDKIENCYARLVDSDSNSEICKYDLNEKGGHTGMIMVKLYRHNGVWKASAIGQSATSRTISDLIEPIKAIL